MIQLHRSITSIYLLAAARWTLLLSLIALRRRRRARPACWRCAGSPRRVAARLATGYHPADPGHAAADACCSCPISASACSGFRLRRWSRPALSLDALCRRLPRRDLARLHRGGAAHRSGRPPDVWRSARFQQHALRRSCRRPCASPSPPTVGFMVQIVQEHLARLDHRLRRAHPRRPDRQQLDVPAVPSSPLVGAIYFALCYPLSLAEPRARKEERHARPLRRTERPSSRSADVTRLRPAARARRRVARGGAAAQSSRSSAAAARARAPCCAASTGSSASRPAASRSPATCSAPAGRALRELRQRRRHGVPELQPVPPSDGRARTSRWRRAW